MKSKKEDYVDKKYGLLTIKNLRFVKLVAVADCTCECGNKHSALLAQIKSGHTKSCGCMALKTRFAKDTKREIINNFGKLTPESAYWAGFIFGDGCIQKRGSLEVGLSALTEFTVGHLQKLSMFIYGKDYVLKYKTVCVLQVANQQLVKNLEKYGIVKNKTYDSSLILPKKYQKDFIRGYFDADGWISINDYKHKNGRTYTRNTFGICSFLKENLDIVKNYLNIDIGIYEKNNHRLFSLASSDRNTIIQIIKKLNTKNKNICYLRKWNKLWKFYNKYNKKLTQID